MSDLFGKNDNDNNNDYGGYDNNGSNNNYGGYDNNGSNNNYGGYDNNGSNNNYGGYDNNGSNNNYGGYDNNGSNNNYGGYNNNGSNNNYGGYNNNGGYYNGGGYYDPNSQFGGMYNGEMTETQKGAGFAIASFVIALVNLILCATVMSFITVPICLVFSLITLIGRRKGTVFAVFGLVISLISGLIFGFYGYIAYKLTPDIIYFSEHSTELREQYEKDGTIPERFQKYREAKYTKYWKRMGYDSFDDLYRAIMNDNSRIEYSSTPRRSEDRNRGSQNNLALGYAQHLVI